MSFMLAANAGFNEARTIYTAGYKSNNKLHIDATSPYASGGANAGAKLNFGHEGPELDAAYIDRMNAAIVQLGGFRNCFWFPPKHFLRAGQAMLRMRPVAANCGDLAQMAAARAWVQLGEPRSAPVALVTLADPADHVFCVVGRRVQCNQLKNITIQELAKSPLAKDMWAVDPWLNVLCQLKDYPARAAAKFQKWQADNKRIAWVGGPIGNGWYPPVGHYSAGFNAAGMEVSLG